MFLTKSQLIMLFSSETEETYSNRRRITSNYVEHSYAELSYFYPTSGPLIEVYSVIACTWSSATFMSPALLTGDLLTGMSRAINRATLTLAAAAPSLPNV